MSTIFGSAAVRRAVPVLTFVLGIVAAFTARLRQTVDLDTVRYDLLGVTENAFQPTHVSVWIAPVSAEQRAAVAAGAELPAGRSRR